MITPGFNVDSQLLETKSPVVVSLQDMFDSIEFMANNHELPRNLKILEDACGTQVTFTAQELKLIGDKLMILTPRFDTIHHAVVHDSPINTVYGMMLSKNYLPKNYILEIFATREAGFNWLKFKH